MGESGREELSDINMAEMRRYRDDTAISAVTHELFTVAKGEYNQNEKTFLTDLQLFTYGERTLSSNL